MPIYPTTAQLRKIRIETYGRGLSGLWKQGWNEYPEIMFASLHGILGICIFGYRAYIHETDIREFKAEYTVYRPDDSRTIEYTKHFKANYTPQRE